MVVASGTFALIVCLLAWQGDARQEAAQRQALRAAVEDSRQILGEFPSLEHQGLALIERNSGVRGLRLESGPGTAGKPAQSVLDRNGRIIGWIGFDPQRALSKFVAGLWPLFAVFLLVLAGLAALAILQVRKMADLLRQSRLQARRLEKLDRLTGLPHHRAFLEQLDAALAMRKPEQVIVVADLDLDRFKEINDGLGHAFGDLVLAAFGERMRSALQGGMTFGRLSGDEFAIAFAAQDADEARRVVAELRQQLARPVWVNDRAVQLGVSAGFAIAPQHAVQRDELLRCAGLALRAAKTRGRDRVVAYDPAMDSETKGRRALERDLKRAIAGEELQLHYQPIVAADGSRILGVEALLRWNHPEHGLIAPPLFVTAAEETGMMDALGEYVLRRALTDARRWPELYISVNVSPVQVRDRKFVELVARVLNEKMVSPSRLVLEMTESVMIDDPEDARMRLEALRGLGVKIALDDFGTGYSSLSYLQRFAFDKLKIDKAFVAPLGRSANSGAMIQAIVALGNALGLSILAEGVETEEQRVLLRLAGCHEMQGFLFSEAVPRESVDAIVAEAKARGGRSAAAPV